jgi:hypothetical protein
MSLLRMLLCVALLLGAGVRTARAGVPPFWVGAGVPCNFNSLQTAIDAVPDGATLRLASNQLYDPINVTITDKSLVIEGGWADCSGTPGDPDVTLSGLAGSFLPVIRAWSPAIDREVLLRNLHIRGGERSGVEIGNHVTLTLEYSRVDENQAATGGGVHVEATPPATAELRVHGSTIGNLDGLPGSGNYANSGGGVFCRHASVMLRGALIRNNAANESGGGLYLDDCTLDTGFGVFVLPGVGWTTAWIANNDAGAGGGVFARGGSALNLGPASNLLAIDGNTAEIGAGVYLTEASTSLLGQGLTISANHAEDNGGAGYITDGASLTLKRNLTDALAARPATPDGIIVLSTTCDEPIECSIVELNRVENFTGGAFYAFDAGLTLQQTVVRGNYSGNGSVLLLANTTHARVENSLIHDNDSNHGDFVRMIDGSTLALNSSTLVGNATGPTLFGLFSDNGANQLTLRNSIVWQPGTNVVSATPADTIVSTCVNAHETQSIVALDHDPGFVDAAGDDYRLQAASANIDACADPFAVPSMDILGYTRPTDLPGSNGDGTFDRGAYELTDTIFADGFDLPIPPF